MGKNIYYILFIPVTILILQTHIAESISMPLPTSQQFFEYVSVLQPDANPDPANAKPIGLGSVADGSGNTLNLKIGLPSLSPSVANSSTGACTLLAGRDFRQDMRNLVIAISQYAKAKSAGFVIIPQNGQELATSDGTDTGAPMVSYLNAIDGQGREDLFYGYDSDDTATLSSVTNLISSVLDIEKANGKKILVTDYCTTPANVSNSYTQNAAKGYISIAQVRGLDSIPGFPAPYSANGLTNINALASANNFLYLLNYSPTYSTRSDVLSAIQATNFDVVIMDAFFSDNTPFTAAEINSLKTKAGGGRRLIISYMSIGEAEDYRFYWQPSWVVGNPCWLNAENPHWAGNYKVHYWDPAWQSYIFGNSNAYLDQILGAGFDGAYLDIIDAFQYFENGGENNCAVSVSSSLVVHIPIVAYSGSNYWADLQYNSNDSTLTLTGAGTVSDVSFYSNCTASTLSSDFKLHIPALLLGNNSYWIDLQYGSSGFVITGGGPN